MYEQKMRDFPVRSWTPSIVIPMGQALLPMAISRYLSLAWMNWPIIIKWQA